MKYTSATLLLLAIGQASAFLGGQTTRNEISLRQMHRRDGVAAPPGQSASLCPAGRLRDDQGSCCAAGATPQSITVGGTTSTCCPNHVYQPVCSEGNECCQSGQFYTNYNATTGESLGTETCCPVGTTVVGTDADAKCVSATRKRDALAHALSRRGNNNLYDPLRTLSTRPDSWRTRLSPHLVADFLLNDYSFQYGGHTFIDMEGRQRSSNVWQKRLLSRMPKLFKFAGAKVVARHIQHLHEVGGQYLALGNTYEIHIDDVPEVYGALVDHPQWDGSFTSEGAVWDQDLIYSILSKHPAWNATIHDRF